MGNLREQADQARADANAKMAEAHAAQEKADELERRALSEGEELAVAAEAEEEQV